MRSREGTCLPCSGEDQAALGKRARLWHVCQWSPLGEVDSCGGRQVLCHALSHGLPHIKERKGSTMEDGIPK